MIDILHLLLRITDQLFESLLKKIDNHDNNHNSDDFSKRPLLKIFFDVLINNCKITKPYKIKQKKESNEASIKLRSLNGNDRLKVLKAFSGENIFFSNFFPQTLNLEVEDYVWSQFVYILEQIKSFSTDPRENPRNSVERLKCHLKTWLGFYLTLKDGKITPYVHAFVYHIPEFLENFLDVNIFNLQGLNLFLFEKKII